MLCYIKRVLDTENMFEGDFHAKLLPISHFVCKNVSLVSSSVCGGRCGFGDPDAAARLNM